jgi:hypothetical protein
VRRLIYEEIRGVVRHLALCCLAPRPFTAAARCAQLKVFLENTLRDAVTYTGARNASTSTPCSRL